MGLFRADSQTGSKVAQTVANFKERNARLGLTPRQQMLNKLWSYYRCEQYENRSTNWDGSRRGDGLEQEAISSMGYIPPGFYDGAASQALPLRYRRPTAPYNLVRVIVDRFTGLLFSQARHPHFSIEKEDDGADPEDGESDSEPPEKFLEKLADAARFWAAMNQARTFGGAQGTVAVGFSFVDGKPIIEVHDARWMYPDFEDRQRLVLRKIEKRFMYPVDRQNKETGNWETVPFWYRRVIDTKSDVVYEPVEVGDGEDPEWIEGSRIDHELGFCPVVWVQNIPVIDDIDGDPDCHGVYDLIETHDSLVSQAHKSLLANMDPTVVIVSNAENLNSISIGSDNAIKLPEGDAKFMEHRGDGPKAGLELADKLRALVLEVAQCVLEHPDNNAKTATEIMRIYSSMLAKADILREQYGERLIKPLMLMILRAAQKLGIAKPRTLTDPAGGEKVTMVREGLRIPGLKGADEQGLVVVPPELVEGMEVNLVWPPYFEESLDDVAKAVTAATQAYTAKLIDREHCSAKLAPFFDVEDIQAMIQDLDDKEQQEKDELFSAMGGVGGGGTGGGFPGGGGGNGVPPKPMKLPKPVKKPAGP